MKQLQMKQLRITISPILLSVLLLSVLISATACMSSAGKQYHQLFLPLNRISQDTGSTTPKPLIDKIIMVEETATDDIYNDYRVVYRESPYQLNYYSYQFWAKKPGKLVRDVILEYFRGNRLFKQTIGRFSEGNPDLLIRATVHIIEEIDLSYTWFAHLKMDIQVKDFKTDKQILFHSFNRRKQLPVKKVEQLPVVLSSILREELDIVIEKLK